MSFGNSLSFRPARTWLGGVVLAVTGAFAVCASAQPADPGGHGAHMMGAGMAGGGPMMGGMMGGPHRMDRMLDAVNATADQRTQIHTIMQAAMNDLRAQHASGAALRDQAAALFAAPTVDANAAEALRQQMQARHDQASKRMLQAMLDVSRVLTPEQRKAIADRMAQRRAMMQRHNAERRALERQ